MKISEFLIKRGIDIHILKKIERTSYNFWEESILFICIKNNYYDLVKLLLEKGANVNFKNNISFLLFYINHFI